MRLFPAMLNVQGKRCLIVGGGAVAQRRARALLDAGANVVVVSPDVRPGLAALPLELRQRPYRADDAAGAALVVIATDDPEVNRSAARDAQTVGALVNRADAPEEGHFTVPAHSHHGPITLAVSTGGASSSAAVAIRDHLAEGLGDNWPKLLACAAAYRATILQTEDPVQRRAKLAKLADDEAMTILKERGEAALRAHYDSL
jgi:precorrin-2 dehydrogenase/sirohydrochlorin ferrochelatase